MEERKVIGRPRELISPFGFPVEQKSPLTKRVDSLKGKVVGLLDNAKPRADVILDVVKNALEKEEIKEFIYEFKPNLTMPLPEEQIKRLSQADVVIGAIGDCGSCTTGLTKDAVALEKLGTPTVIVCTPGFGRLAALVAAGQGMAQLPVVALKNPPGWAGGTSKEDMRKYTKEILADIQAAATGNISEVVKTYGAHRFLGKGLQQEQKVIKVGKDQELRAFAEQENLIIDMLPEPETLMDFLEDNMSLDGLPVIPPTKDRVLQMLEYTSTDPNETILQLPPRNGNLTPTRLAACAVMAGCKPEYYPVLETAFRAMSAPEFNLPGIAATTGEIWPSIIVSGPYAEKIGMNHGIGLLGPGNRANNTIGRAVTLALYAVGGAFPGSGSFAPFGQLTRKGLAFSVDPDSAPFEPLNVEKGYPNDTIVMVVATLSPSNVWEESESSENVLTLASYHIAAPGSLGNYNPGEVIVIFSPMHRLRFQRDGWSTDDIKRFFYENARVPVSLIKDRGPQVNRKRWPKWISGNNYDGMVPFLREPEDAIILAGGGATAGCSMVIPTWVGGSKSQIMPITCLPQQK